jgi:uncharacterized membrane protein YgdD (TMEM256/DUF423 family)
MVNKKNILVVGSALAGLAVALGAFGAHALKELLIVNNRADTFELAVRYQFYHSIGIIIIGILLQNFNHRLLRISAVCFIAGIILFSGSLYVLAILNTTKLVLLTPLGGLCFIAGWALFAYSIWKSKAIP